MMKIRTKQPKNNKYYIRTVSGGLNGAVAGKPTISGANVLCNCVGYANGRFNESINDPDLKGVIFKFKYQLTCNAENFIESAKKQGLKGVTTETGAGQWGTALSMACAYLDLDCKVYMVKGSYELKPFRREVMRTYGADVTPSPSMTTEIGKRINEEHPGTTGSLGCAISEAVEAASKLPNARYLLGSVLNQVCLHQSIIGL